MVSQFSRVRSAQAVSVSVRRLSRARRFIGVVQCPAFGLQFGYFFIGHVPSFARSAVCVMGNYLGFHGLISVSVNRNVACNGDGTIG